MLSHFKYISAIPYYHLTTIFFHRSFCTLMLDLQKDPVIPPCLLNLDEKIIENISSFRQVSTVTREGNM